MISVEGQPLYCPYSFVLKYFRKILARFDKFKILNWDWWYFENKAQLICLCSFSASLDLFPLLLDVSFLTPLIVASSASHLFICQIPTRWRTFCLLGVILPTRFFTMLEYDVGVVRISNWPQVDGNSGVLSARFLFVSFVDRLLLLAGHFGPMLSAIFTVILSLTLILQRCWCCCFLLCVNFCLFLDQFLSFFYPVSPLCENLLFNAFFY